MTKEQMEKTLKDVDLLEKDLMRDLTEEESTLVCEQGFKALFDKLEFDDEDFKTLRAIRQLISAFCTLSIDDYEAELMKNNYAAIDVLETIVNDLREIEQKKCVNSCTKIGTEEDLKTKVRIINKDRKITDHGYLESEDPELDSYFSKESTEEANEALDTYDPEKDKDIFMSKTSLDEYVQTLSNLNDNSNLDKSIGYSIKQLLDKFKSKEIEYIDLSDKEIEELFDYISKNYNNFQIKDINGKVFINIKD